MKEPKAVEILEHPINKGEYTVTGYWDGENRAGGETTFASKGDAYRWAKEHGLIVCTRPTGHVPVEVGEAD